MLIQMNQTLAKQYCLVCPKKAWRGMHGEFLVCGNNSNIIAEETFGEVLEIEQRFEIPHNCNFSLEMTLHEDES